MSQRKPPSSDKSGFGQASPPVATVEPNVSLAYDGYTDEGENIGGNDTWYFTAQGQWFWSGGIS